MTRLRAPLLFTIAIAAAACSDSSSSTDAGSPDASSNPRDATSTPLDAEPAADAAVDPDAEPVGEDAAEPPDTGATACGTPTNARVIATTADGTLAAPPGKITVDGTTLYFGSSAGILSVPIAGGANTTILPAGTAAAVVGVINDTLVVATNQGVKGTVPKAGGTFTPFTFAVDEGTDFVGFDPATSEYYTHVTDNNSSTVRAQSFVSGDTRTLASATMHQFRFDLPVFQGTNAVFGYAPPILGGSPNSVIIQVPKNGDPVVYGEVMDATINANTAVLGQTDDRTYFYVVTSGNLTVISTNLMGGDVKTVYEFVGDSFAANVLATSATHVAAPRVHRKSATERDLEIYAIDSNTTPANSPIKSTIQANEDECFPNFPAMVLTATEVIFAVRLNGVTTLYAVPL